MKLLKAILKGYKQNIWIFSGSYLKTAYFMFKNICSGQSEFYDLIVFCSNTNLLTQCRINQKAKCGVDLTNYLLSVEVINDDSYMDYSVLMEDEHVPEIIAEPLGSLKMIDTCNFHITANGYMFLSN